MMRRWWFLFLLGSSLLWSQAKPSAPNDEPEAKSHLAEDDDDDREEPPAPPSATRVTLNAPVITIKGFCPARAATAATAHTSCKTTITRAEFERLASAIQPDMRPAVKQRLASAYPQLLVMSHEAQSEGMDKQERFQQTMAYVRMQILTQAFIRELQRDAAHISERDVADYYQKNRKSFVEFTLQRLMVPLHQQGQPQDRSAEKEFFDLAQNLRQRAIAGEDLSKLQKEAFDAAGIHLDAANTKMGKVRGSSLPVSHAAALELEPGGISQLITDSGGHYIYKLEAKDQLSLRQVKDEIRSAIKNQRIKDALDEVQKSYSSEINDRYFGSESAGHPRVTADAGGRQK